ESIIAHVDGRPIVWSDFPSNGQTVDQVTICEFGRPDCCVTTQFDTPDCTGSCDIRQITAQPLGCDSRGNFLVELDFESINTSDSFFVVDQGNNRYGAFSYNNLPIRLGPFAGDGVTEYSFAVIDEELRSCAGDIIIGTINCDSNSVCGIRDINVQVEDCTSNTSFSLVLDLLFNGPTGDTLLLRGSTSGYQQAFTKGQLPLRISNYPYNPNIRGEELIVCDGDNPNCCVRSFFEYPDCGGNQVCRIEQLTATPGECTSDSTYKLTIDMIYSGNPTDSFVVYRDPPNVIGAWTVDQLPLTIDNFSSGNAPADAILVCFEFPSCCESIGWAVPDCSDYSNDCELGQMTATAGPCDANGRFMVDIDFDRFNTSDSFDLAYQRVISRFSYTDLPVSVGSFEADGRTVYEFFVTDKDNPDCVTGIELGPVDCDTIVECQISNFVLTAGDCLTDSSYNLTVDFDVVNPGSRTFTLTSNGQDIGSFPIDELPLTVEYFGGQDSLDIIALCIDNQPNCCTRGVVQRPDCLNNDCQIRSLEAYPLDCNGDGTYSLIVDMTIWNADSDSFLLSSDAGFIGTFAYDDLPLFLPDFESNGDSIDFLYAFDQIDTICEKETFFPALLCGQCDISDLEAEIVDCEDGSFYVQLDFDFGNVGNIGFQVIGNGQRYGNYDYSDLPVLLGPFRSDPPNRRLDFTVFDLVNFDCRAETALRAPDCPEGEDIEVWPGDANRDNISNHFDLLELGVAFGHTGTRRPTLSSDWGGYSSNDWDLDFASGHNYKHADCNGDGVIDQKDIQVIEDNYGQSHGPIAPYDWPRGDENDPPVLVDLEAAAPRSGQSFRAPLVVGLPSQPVDSIYGIAFTLQFGGSTTIPLNTRVLVEDSWLGKKDETMVSIDRTFAGNGIIQVAITRIDQRNVSGHGQVASFIGIIDNISGRAAMEVEVVAIKAITFEQAPVLLMGQNSAIDIITNVKIPDNTDMLRLYPNPATQVLKIHDMGQAGMNRIRIYNSLGQLVREVDPADDMESVDVSQWAPGIYFAEVQFGVRVVTKKFKVSR
ncbi:MAG: T9SS type A sorting domain-containing protein, partial [Bacteroidota bacterium]